MDKIQHQTAKAERSALTTSFSSEGAAQGPPSRATKFAGHIANQPHAMKILLKPRRPSCYKSRYCHKIRCTLNATTEKECKQHGNGSFQIPNCCNSMESTNSFSKVWFLGFWLYCGFTVPSLWFLGFLVSSWLLVSFAVMSTQSKSNTDDKQKHQQRRQEQQDLEGQQDEQRQSLTGKTTNITRR